MNAGSSVQAKLDWSYFHGRIFCLTLKSTPLRRTHAIEQFKKVNLDGVVEFIERDTDPEGPMMGIWRSHLHILKTAYERGLDHVLVFEDDVVFDLNNINQTLINKCVNFVSEQEYDVFYLGHIPWWAKKTTAKDILQVRSVMLHSHIVSRRWMTWLFKNLPKMNSIPIDDYYCFSSSKSYAIDPMFCYQRDDEVLKSTNNWGVMGEFRRRCQLNHELWCNNWSRFLSKHVSLLPLQYTKYLVAGFALINRVLGKF